jgi:hypothetical protein
MKIFWSWQSDTPAAEGRNFVKTSLSAALAQLADELEWTEAERAELDHDTKDVPGLAPIADTIFDKIDNAAIFVADVTSTGATPDGKKKTPNPNVLIELGYALKSLGPQRVVLVANGAGGFRPEDLPFDLRHRRGPITYDLKLGADKSTKEKVMRALTSSLASALRTNLKSMGAPVDDDPPLYPSMPEDRALWFDRSLPIGLHDNKISRLREGAPLAYLRVSASGWSSEKPSRSTIKDLGIAPFGEWSTGSGAVPNGLGVLAGGWYPRIDEVSALTQWFDKTAEIWGVSPGYGFHSKGHLQLATHALARQLRHRLSEWIALLKKLGARGPYRVEAGLTGIQDIYWPIESDFFELPKCLDPEVVIVRSGNEWDQGAQLRFLTTIFEKICDSFAIARLGSDEVERIST